MMHEKELIILIVEDDDGHAELIQTGLRESGMCNTMLRFADGEKVWQFLTGTGTPVRDKRKTYLLLLDINISKIDGLKVLKRIKDSEELKVIPVIILTTTDDPQEVEECYQLGCSAYITKPVDFEKFAEILYRLGLFVQIMTI